MTFLEQIQEKVYTVPEISLLIQQTLEEEFPYVFVEGEVSGFKRAASGHIYFSLVGEDPSKLKVKLECVVYKSSRLAKQILLTEGQKIIAQGRITTWSGKSSYQLIVENYRDVGLGDLFRRLEVLRKKLLAEGLFDEVKKRPLPFIPHCIGIVTSLKGAAIRDMVRTILSRFPTKIIIAPALVQGQGAPEDIAKGIATLNEIPEVDVIIVGRGGGSLEDLWAFNEEIVLRAIAQSRAPVISAVGHEIDHPLSDDVADKRASTPTAAGQIVVPDRNELYKQLDDLEKRFTTSITRKISDAFRILDDLEGRLQPQKKRIIETARLNLNLLAARLQTMSPHMRLKNAKDRARDLEDRLKRLRFTLLTVFENKLERLETKLKMLSPLEPLNRGYSITFASDGTLIQRYDQVALGDEVEVWLKVGALGCHVKQISEHDVRSKG